VTSLSQDIDWICLRLAKVYSVSKPTKSVRELWGVYLFA